MRDRTPPGTHGKITTRKNKTGWTARTIYRDHNGTKRDISAQAPTKARAQTKLQEKLQTYTPHKQGLNDRTTLNNLLQEWAEATQHEIKEGTHAYRLSTIRALNRRIGEHQLKDIKPSTIQATIEDIATKRNTNDGGTYAARSALITIRQALDYAIRFDAIPHNPAARLKPPPQEKKPVRALTLEEAHQVRDIIKTHCAEPRNWRSRTFLPDLVDFMLATGCRVGEALAVTQEDVDADILTVQRIRTQHGEFQRTKNGKTRRIKLPSWVMPMVRRRLIQSPNGHLFWNSRGNPVGNSNAHVALQSALPEEFSWVTFHIFRKTVATVLAAEVSPAEVARQLGNTARTAEASYIQVPELWDAGGRLEGLG